MSNGHEPTEEVPEEDLPLADASYERTAHELFPYRTMSPQEYAVREGWKWAVCSFISHRYRDPELQAWLYEFGVCVRSKERMKELRHTLLTPEERVALEKEMKEYWDNF